MAPLPGGDIPGGDMASYKTAQAAKYKFLPDDLLDRYIHTYGTRMDLMLENVRDIKSMGRDFGSGLYEREIMYLIEHEFAKTAEDILWRRTKLGLHAEKRTVLSLESAMPEFLKERKAA